MRYSERQPITCFPTWTISRSWIGTLINDKKWIRKYWWWVLTQSWYIPGSWSMWIIWKMNHLHVVKTSKNSANENIYSKQNMDGIDIEWSRLGHDPLKEKKWKELADPIWMLEGCIIEHVKMRLEWHLPFLQQYDAM